MSLSPQLRALGPDIRLLVVLIDGIAAYGHYCEEVQARLDTAMLAETEDGEGWHHGEAERQLHEWGVADQHGVYLLAGLTKRQAEVAFLFFDRCLQPKEIAGYLGIDPVTVRLHLHKAEERLRRLAA